jgi:23S rRNA (uridine2552-2'-O)-methyltransferase
MAPNTVGHRETDHLRIVGLIEMGAEFAIEVLKPGGAFVAKAFQGGETADVIARLKKNFDKVVHYKPKASRPTARRCSWWRLDSGGGNAGRAACW